MKKLLFTLLFVPCIGFAKPQPVTFNFEAVSLVTFAQTAFKGILGRDYVISPDVVAMDRKITLSVKAMEPGDVADFVQGILAKQGIAVTDRDGVYYLDQIPLADRHGAAPSGSGDADRSEHPNFAQVMDAVQGKGDTSLSGNGIDSRRGADADKSKIDPSAESRIYTPMNRPADFMMEVINAGFGQKPAQLAGGQIIVTANKARLEKIFALVEKLDTVPKKVDVSASWIEVTQTNGAVRGISLIATVLGAKFGATLGAINSGSALSLGNANFQLVIDALNSDTRFNQVSNSRIIGDDYVKMNLTVGNETPTVSSTGKDNAGNAIQNIVMRPSGVITEVTPRVLGSGKINMDIDGQISSFQVTTTGVNGTPTLIKREVKTSVTVGNGEVLFIGGLNDTQSTRSTSGLAFLPTSWSAKSENLTQTDLVLILAAKVSE